MKYISLALKISITYFLFGLLWIYFSDNAINLLVKDLEKLQFLQTIKGWLFITFSSILIYFISYKLFTQIESKKEELLKSNELLEKIIENAPLIIFWKSNIGVYLGCNSKFLQLMNLSSKDELLGKVDSDFSILEKENFINDDMIVISSGQPKLNYLETITTKNKVLKILNTSKVPLFDDKGKIIGVLGVRDVADA